MNHHSFLYHIPTKVEFGTGVANQTGQLLTRHLSFKHVGVITDEGIRKAGILDTVEDSLKQEGIVYTVYHKVTPNPSSAIVEEAASQLAEADVLLAVGGGSSIDTAKAVAVVATNGGNILQFEGVNKFTMPSLPIAAIPTTAGTGSEITSATVITNEQTHFKASIISPHIFPKLAIVDPELTLSLPPGVTAATGIDALTHAIESYTSKAANGMSEAMALHAIHLISKNIRQAYFVGNDVDSRKNMLLASLMAGAAFSQSRLGNVHAMSHTLGGVFNIAHGVANAALLPYVMTYNLPACPHKMADIAQAFGENVHGLSPMEAGEKAIDVVLNLNKELGIPNNIQELGVSSEYLPKLIDDSMKSGNVHVNPRQTTAKDIEHIFLAALSGDINAVKVPTPNH